MAEFSHSSWKQRAAERHRRAILSAKPGHAAQYKSELNAIDQLASVIDWCAKKNLKVNFDCKRLAAYYPETREIRCNLRSAPSVQLFLLLHECGHFLIGDGHDKFPLVGEAEEDPTVKRLLAHRVDVVSEELEAWHRGRCLAERLGISVNKRDYDRLRARCLKGYMSWVLNPGDFKKD